MKHRILRTKQEEYWDIWCEDAIVFPETMPLVEAFSEDNLRKLLLSYSDKEEYPTYIIEVVDDNWVEVVIYAKGQDAENCTEDIHFEFVEMSKVLVVA
jgi:hypothetical protein